MKMSTVTSLKASAHRFRSRAWAYGGKLSQYGETDAQIGYLWLNVDEEKRSCFICDIYLHESFRGQGRGRKTLELLEIQMAARNVQKIGLHVFGDNVVARELYTKVGYQVTGLNMQKWLEVKI